MNEKIIQELLIENENFVNKMSFVIFAEYWTCTVPY